MAKFNWNRFYDELESADPKKFPYWMWMFKEMFNFLAEIIIGSIVAFLFTVVGMFLVLDVAQKFPDLTAKMIVSVCENGLQKTGSVGQSR